MNKKGFTLIELLAVIVILAIIALIATPIILGIIEDARNGAKDRSAEAVAHAMETAYLTAYMNNNGSGEGITVKDVIDNTKIDNEKERTETSIKTDDGVTCSLSEDFKVTCDSPTALTKDLVTE